MIKQKVKSVVIPECGALTVTGIYNSSIGWVYGRSSQLVFSATVTKYGGEECIPVFSAIAEIGDRTKYPAWHINGRDDDSCNWLETLWQLFYNDSVSRPLYEHDTVMMLLAWPKSPYIDMETLGPHLRDVIKLMLEVQHELMPKHKAEFMAYIANLEYKNNDAFLMDSFEKAKCAVSNCARPIVGDEYGMDTFLCMHRYSTFSDLQEEEKDAACEKYPKIISDKELGDNDWTIYEYTYRDNPLIEWDEDTACNDD